MSNIVVGKQTAELQPLKFGYQPGRGFYKTIKWKITNQAELPALLGQLVAAGYSYDVDTEANGAIVVVEAKVEDTQGKGPPETTPLREIWERDTQMSEKDILESDLAIINTLAQDKKELIRNAIQSPPASSSPAVSGDSLTVYLLMLNGVRTIKIFSPVVRRTRLTANSYTVAESDTNVGKILTTSQMTSLEGTPSTVLFALPSNSTVRSDISVRYGWMKKPSRVQQQGDGRWQIVQEYEYDLWSTVLYANAS